MMINEKIEELRNAMKDKNFLIDLKEISEDFNTIDLDWLED